MPGITRVHSPTIPRHSSPCKPPPVENPSPSLSSDSGAERLSESAQRDRVYALLPLRERRIPARQHAERHGTARPRGAQRCSRRAAPVSAPRPVPPSGWPRSDEARPVPAEPGCGQRRQGGGRGDGRSSGPGAKERAGEK